MIEHIMLSWPFSVSFNHGGNRYTYIIDIGGLRRIDERVHHQTPGGSFCFDGASLDEIQQAAAKLGATIFVSPHVLEGTKDE